VKDMMAGGRLDAGHGRALLALERSEDQVALAREAARKGLSVREVERRVALQRAPRPRRSAHRDPNTRAAEERLRAVLGTRVQIARRGKSGTLRIAFATEAELQRIYELLLRAGRGR
jgi:ParB family chromosome partitioning protein